MIINSFQKHTIIRLLEIKKIISQFYETHFVDIFTYKFFYLVKILKSDAVVLPS